jgi:hypothetical protein
MFKLFKGLGILAAVISSIGSASAATLFEDVDVTYSNSTPFSLTSVTLVLTGGSTNLLGSFNGGTLSGSGTILNEVIQLTAGDSYTFSFAGHTDPGPGSNISGTAAIFASTVPTSTSTNLNNPGVFNITVGATLSPVPLPSGFPLFAMGLIALGAFGYHSVRSRKNGEITAAV